MAILTVLLAGASPAAAGGGHALIEGSGSSWAANAVNQWIADVHSNGLQVVFTSSGSAVGRQDYANVTTDFAVSDIGYQNTDSASGQSDTPNGRSVAYLPIVAGGTALPYHIVQNGALVRNVRLSGPTIARIFTGAITNWDDPRITADNNGRKLPNLSIIPVVHSEGSGSSYQFTRYLAKQFPSIWHPFSHGQGASEYFPSTGHAAVRENGSDQIMNFLTSGAGDGAIGYDEYSYALGKGYPVAKVLNSGGYYTLPNQYNVAVALTKAQINTNKSSPNYLLQDLDNVYSYSDKRVYPISSYSYAIIPWKANDRRMTTAKRQTLVDYLDYSVCQGQAEMGRIGYSPLPINLVQASFAQVSRLHAADSKVSIANTKVTACHNPTFVAGNPKANYLAKVAPFPDACDRSGSGPCAFAGNTGQANPTSGGKVARTGGGSGGGGSGGSNGNANGNANGNGNGGGGSGGRGGSNGGGGAAGGASAGASSGAHVDPNTGQLVNNTGGSANGGTLADGSTPVAQQTVLGDDQSGSTDLTLAVLAGALLLALLIVPPALAMRLQRSKLTKGRP